MHCWLPPLKLECEWFCSHILHFLGAEGLTPSLESFELALFVVQLKIQHHWHQHDGYNNISDLNCQMSYAT